MRSTARTALAAVALLLPPALLSGQTDTLSSADRAMLVRDLDESRSQFLASINGLSEAQWRYKPAPDRWSIAEVAEHVVATDQLIGSGALVNLQPITALPADSAARLDAAVRGLYQDRSRKFNASQEIQPSGRFATQAALVAALGESREKTIEYARTTRDPLRTRGSPHPAFGQLDGVQWVIVLSAHMNRHVQQIEEVKRSVGYPKM